jgi:hypothetical protein
VPSREIGLLNNKAPLLAWDNLQLRLASKTTRATATSGAAATAEAQDGTAGALTSFDEFTQAPPAIRRKQVHSRRARGREGEQVHTLTSPGHAAKGAK